MPATATFLLTRVNHHRAWVNENLLAAAEALSDAQLRRAFPIGQGSVWKSLLHLYAAEYVWLEALLGDDDPCCPGDVRGKLPGNQLGEGGPQSLAELRQSWTAQEQRWRQYVSAVAADTLDDPIAKTSVVVPAGGRLIVLRAEVILHVCLHAQYTAAQALNMLRQLGVETFPKTMLTQLIWQERSA
jgi:uncharacterized damage-inducible protein DinB